MGTKEPNPSPNRWNKIKVRPSVSTVPPPRSSVESSNEKILEERIQKLEYKVEKLQRDLDDHIYRKYYE